MAITEKKNTTLRLCLTLFKDFSILVTWVMSNFFFYKIYYSEYLIAYSLLEFWILDRGAILPEMKYWVKEYKYSWPLDIHEGPRNFKGLMFSCRSLYKSVKEDKHNKELELWFRVMTDFLLNYTIVGAHNFYLHVNPERKLAVRERQVQRKRE